MTFLFTDVEGSTRRWEADAEEMHAALVAHDEVLRNAIAAHGGFLFKHTGDGVCAAFSSPRSAVDAAVAAQRQLELPVRMGLATGEAELREGDYFGAVLNRAARVMAAGHGGQILLVDSTASLLSGVDLLQLGPRRLRDVPMPVGVFQVRAAGLRSEFPPLRALDTSPGNLRPITTSLIGRESEVAKIEAAVKAHRLVTLTGVGGVGKTRLALEVAERLADEFPDGVWLFELAAVTDPAAVPDAVAAVLGITQQPGKTVSESVAAALEGRVRLLVIDNCEHILDAAADLVEAILEHSATVRVLATSREGLGAADERLFRVPSLDLNSGSDSAAVSLFVERAHSVEPDFSLAHSGEMDAAVDICRKLDGIPLAIELAASRMASMTATEVRDRLDQRFQLLVGSRRGLERHQTLRHAVAWSYDLLGDAEKSLLARCSVFAGGFDLESACAVASPDASGDYAVLNLLDALVRKSLLVAERSFGRTRFSMLETIRQFAEEQLVARGEGATVRAAHARHFGEREADMLAMWDSPRQRQAYDWFATELANLRVAFRWAADHHEFDVAAAVSSYAGLLGLVTENYEPSGWAEEVIEAARAADHPRLAEIYAVASLCYLTGRLDEGVHYTDAARDVLLERRGALPSHLEGMIGGAYMSSGHPERWVEWCRAQPQDGPDINVLNRTSLIFGLVNGGGSLDEAIEATKGLVEAAEATANPFMLSFALYADSFAFRETDPDRALDAARRGLMIAQDSGNRLSETQLVLNLGRLEAMHGDIASAFDHLSQAIRTMHDSGDVTTITTPLAALAALFDRLGRHEPAATIAGFALSPLSALATPEINTAIAHLRDVLGDQTYESLARKGALMTRAAVARYAYDQIDQARAQLNAVSNS
ncbi:cyclase [Mycobacterium sp. 1165178.9]|nr:cyclase [Mycobacterium sp. 1165178.9]